MRASLKKLFFLLLFFKGGKAKSEFREESSSKGETESTESTKATESTSAEAASTKATSTKSTSAEAAESSWRIARGITHICAAMRTYWMMMSALMAATGAYLNNIITAGFVHLVLFNKLPNTPPFTSRHAMLPMITTIHHKTSLNKF